MTMNIYQHGGNVYEALRKRGGQLSELLDYSANINPLGVPPTVMAAIQAALANIVHYPDPAAIELKNAISVYYSVPTEQITVGNGAIELLYVLCHTLKPRRALVTAPTFSEYERSALAAGAEVEYLYLAAENNFALDNQLLASRMAEADLVFLGNPNNPTGTLLTQAQIKQLLTSAAEHNTYVVMDESFIDFLPNDTLYTSRPLLNTFPNLVIIHSLTKFYAIPGLRLGFAFASKQLTQALHTGKDPWNVNSLAQAAGAAALGDTAYQQNSRELIAAAKDNLYSRLAVLPGLKPYYPTVNFLLVDISGTGLTSAKLRQAMLEHNILIRDCSNYHGLSNKYIRLAVKTPEQNERLLKALARVL